MLAKLQLPVKLEKRGGCAVTDNRLSSGTHVPYFLGVLGRYSLCCLYPVDRPFTPAELLEYIRECPPHSFFRTVSGLAKYVVTNEMDGWIWFYTNDPSAGVNNNRVLSPFRTSRVVDGVTLQGPGFTNHLPRFVLDAVLELAQDHHDTARAILQHAENVVRVMGDGPDDDDDEKDQPSGEMDDAPDDEIDDVPDDEIDVVNMEEEENQVVPENRVRADVDADALHGMEESDEDQDQEVDGGIVQRPDTQQPVAEPDHSDSDIQLVVDIGSEDGDDVVRSKLADCAVAFIAKCSTSAKGRKRARFSCRVD